MDTCIEYCEANGWAYMSSDEPKWRSRLSKLAKQFPDEMILLKRPEDNGGVIYCKFPQKWVRVAPPVKRPPLSEEEKAARRACLAAYREQNKERNEEYDQT